VVVVGGTGRNRTSQPLMATGLQPAGRPSVAVGPRKHVPFLRNENQLAPWRSSAMFGRMSKPGDTATNRPTLFVTLTVDEVKALIREAVREEVTTSAPEQAFLGPEDVAKMLGVQTRSIATYVYRDGLPCIRVSDRIFRFTPGPVNAWHRPQYPCSASCGLCETMPHRGH
jgi:hypothetical protein